MQYYMYSQFFRLNHKVSEEMNLRTFYIVKNTLGGSFTGSQPDDSIEDSIGGLDAFRVEASAGLPGLFSGTSLHDGLVIGKERFCDADSTKAVFLGAL